jgi:hypothetical protein
VKLLAKLLPLTLACALAASSAAFAETDAPEAPTATAKPEAHKPKPKAHKPKPTPEAEKPPAPAIVAPVVLPDPPTPVVQARQVGLERCAPMLAAMSRETLTTTYDVQSGWSSTAPNSHVFQTVAALTRPGNVPPDGLAALVAAPLASGGCDGVVLQVFPMAGDCAGVQQVLLKGGGRTIGPMLNTRVMVDSAGRRLFLLPGYASTCIAIAVDSRFAPN